MTNRGAAVLMLLGLLLIIAALGLCGYNLWQEKQGEEGSGMVLAVMNQAMLEQRNTAEPASESEVPPAVTETATAMPTEPAPEQTDALQQDEETQQPAETDAVQQVTPAPEQTENPELTELPELTESPEPTSVPEPVIPDYIKYPDMEMPEIKVEGNTYIGTLSIPVLELELPVMSNWSYPQLKIAPCRYSGSAYRDNFVVMAHNYATHFGRLKALQPGDLLAFTDVEGHRFFYKVALIETLRPREVYRMLHSDYPLTLFTCTIGGATRVTVRCERVEMN